MNDFPKLGINAEDLVGAVEALICEAYVLMKDKKEDFGAVNWGDLGVCDVEYRLSMLRPGDGPSCFVLVEEASPGCKLEGWLTKRLDAENFPRTYVVCEW